MVHVVTNSSKESKREGIRDVLKFAPNAFPPKQTGLSTSTCVWGALGVASLGGVGSISSTKFMIAAVVGAFLDKCATSITVLLASRERRGEAIDMKTGTTTKTGTTMKTGTATNGVTIVMSIIRTHHQDHIEQKQQTRSPL